MTAATATPLPRLLARVIAGAGIAADATLFVLKAPGAFTWSTHLFALWLALPWLVVLLLAWRLDVPGLLAGALLAAAFEAIAFHVTFVAPRGSTSALIYAVKPLWQLGLVAAAIVGAVLVARVRGRG
ncbi:MAG: hypothetical protein ABI886_08100 [Betaproteobacteria bacterium]